MGVLLSLERVIQLKIEKIILEFRLQRLSSRLIRTMQESSRLDEIVTDLDHDESVVQAAESRRAQLKILEKTIDEEQTREKAILQAITTEMESAEKMMNDSIGKLFKYSGQT